MDPKNVIQETARAIRKYLPEKEWKIVLYGSRAKGSARTGSDIDIGIIGPAEVPWSTMVKILNAVEEIRTLRSVDIVDLRASGDEFRLSVLEYAIPVQV